MYGRKRIFLAGNLLTACSSFLAYRAGSYAVLVGARALGGLAGVMIVPSAMAILVSVYPVQERGRVLGLSVAGVYLGFFMGPLLGGWLTQYLGWRSIFGVTVPAGLAVFAIVLWKVKGEWAEAGGERLDL